MRRYSISIAPNLAEGSGRISFRDKARLTEITYSSSLKLLNQVVLSADLEYINEKEYTHLSEKIVEVSMLIDLYKSQKANFT